MASNDHNASRAKSASSPDRPSAERLAQLQAVYDGAPVGLAFLDRELRYVSLNRRLASMNGRPMEEHIGRTVYEMVPEVFPMVEPYIRRALQGEAIPGVEITKPASGPNPGKTILLSYEPARNEAGDVVGVSVALLDVTPIKDAEAARRESEAHFRGILETVPQIPWIIDSEGRALDVSQRWLEITGMTDQQWRGFGWLDALHPEDRQTVLDAMQRSFKSGEPIDLYYRVRRSDNSPWKRLHSRGTASIGADGKIKCWYGYLEPTPEKMRMPISGHGAS
jgi:PAS domain S-box-containing protein